MMAMRNPGPFQRLLARLLPTAGQPSPALPGHPAAATHLSAVTSQVDDSAGYTPLTSRPHDYDPAQVYELYQDALTAWRKNPIAWRIIAITTDYVVGDQITVSSPNRSLNTFIRRFWNHPKNLMDLRLESLCDELARAGDLFILLFRNPVDGMSYLRLLTKDQIIHIETAPNDWETEYSYTERTPEGAERVWYSPDHPRAAEAEAICLHYAVNRPAGALLGESDLTTMLPWLQRYSRMLDDRVRLNWAMRSFLWFVTVPSARVREKQEQYRTPPETGSIIIKDESETWEAKTPTLHAIDAREDMRAVRQMIDAGSGYPAHWRGEAGDANLATATAMQGPTERHLLRRQQYFKFMLQDILFHAYQRAVQIGRARPLGSNDYRQLFTISAPDVSRWDNESLARSGQALSNAWAQLLPTLQQAGRAPHTRRLILRSFLRFTGEPTGEETLESLLQELAAAEPPAEQPAVAPPAGDPPTAAPAATQPLEGDR